MSNNKYISGERGREVQEECPSGTCGGSARIGKSSLCIHHYRDWVRPELSMDTNSRGSFDEKQDIIWS